ncbi:MAG: hypothetical protein ABI556_13755 [Gemmatimonadales bacterium]
MTSSSSESESADSHPRPRAIVAGHGTFPEGIITAVNQISGCGDVFLPISNSGLSGSDIESTLREASADIRVFFTDLPGGSATLAVRRLMRTDSRIVLVTGANLATLLEFVFQPDTDPCEAAKKSAEKGRAAIVAYGGE